MLGMMARDPIAIAAVSKQVGYRTLFAWFGHWVALLANTVGAWLVRAMCCVPGVRGVLESHFVLSCFAAALEWGSGMDHGGNHRRGAAGEGGEAKAATTATTTPAYAA